MKALLFGSIGTIVETSEIQRQSYNKAFKDLDLNWYWNIATYCKLLENAGGKKRIKEYSKNTLDQKTINLIHSKKEEYYEKLLSNPLSPRPGIKDTIELCIESNVSIGFITTTSLKNINSIKHALKGTLDFSNFQIITSLEDTSAPKPSNQIYLYALKKLGLSKNEVIAIEDTYISKTSAINAGIECYFFPGEYALVNNNDKLSYEIFESLKEIIQS